MEEKKLFELLNEPNIYEMVQNKRLQVLKIALVEMGRIKRSRIPRGR